MIFHSMDLLQLKGKRVRSSLNMISSKLVEFKKLDNKTTLKVENSMYLMKEIRQRRASN